MKKLYSLSLLLAAGLSYGQVSLPHTESFNYAVDSNLDGQGGWVNNNSGDEVTIASGNLNYAGLLASTGNMVTFGESGKDPQITFTEQTTGVVYASFIINIAEIDNLTAEDGGYFAGFGQSSTVFASTVWLKPSGNGFVVGLNKATATADTQYGTTEYALNTNHLVVIAFDIDNQTSQLWVNPSAEDFAAENAPAADLTASTGSDRTSMSVFFLRQDSTTETPTSMNLDEVRLSTAWADVTPAATNSLNQNNIAGLKVYPNPLTGNVLNITSDNNADKIVVVYDVLGKQVLTAQVINGTVNVSALTSGVYIVKVTEEGKTATKKLVVR